MKDVQVIQPERHLHPISIISQLSHFLYLLLIPLIRGLLAVFRGGFYEWLSGSWIDLFVVFVIVFLGVINWHYVRYIVKQDSFILKKGIFIRKRWCIPKENITTLSMDDYYWFKPFRAVMLNVDTYAFTAGEFDLSILIRKRDAQWILSENIEAKPHNIHTYHIKSSYVVIVSALLSNSFAGIILLSTFITNAGKILGEQLTENIYGTLTEIMRRIAFGIPPAALLITCVLLIGWLITFFTNILRYKNFTASRSEDHLIITSGIFTNRYYSAAIKSVNYLDVRQSLVTKFLRLNPIYLDCVGLGKRRDDVSAIIPICRRKNRERYIRMLVPHLQPSKRQIKPNAGSIFKFILDPLWPCLLIPVAIWLVYRLLPNWRSFTIFAGVCACIPAYWWMAVRLVDFFTSGMAREGDNITMYYSKGYSLHTIVIPMEKIAQINIRQSILQKQDNRCDVIIYTDNERRVSHHCRNLLRSDVYQMFGLTEEHRVKNVFPSSAVTWKEVSDVDNL